MNDRIEAAAFAIYRTFIFGGVGTCMYVTTKRGKVEETPDEACARRWKRLPPATRESFLREAIAALEAAEGIQ